MADLKISQLPSATTPLAGTEVLPIVQSGTTKQVSIANLTTGRVVSATQFTSTITTGTAPFVVASTTEVTNLKSSSATSSDSVKSNATTGLLQVSGPSAAATRVMTTPDANFTVARTDAAQSFTGDQTLATGNLVIGTSGKGIDFSATPQPAGMTSELLADYEEGNWTPATTLSGATYTAQTGQYVKVGKVVTCIGYVAWSAHSNAGNNLAISGLPYAISASSYYPPGIIGGNLASAAGHSIQTYIPPSTSAITILDTTDSTGSSGYYKIPATAAITVVYTYITD